MRLHPCCLRGHQRIGRNHSLGISGGCGPQILLCAFKVFLRHRHLVRRLLLLSPELGDLEGDLFLGVLHPEPCQDCLSLGLTHFLHGPAPMEDRDVHRHADIEHPGELVLESAVKVWVGDEIIRCKSYLRHHVGPCQRHFPVIYLRREIQAPDFRPGGEHLIVAHGRAHFRHWDALIVLVKQLYVRTEIQTAQLAQKHLAEGQAVGGFGQKKVGFICLDFHRQQVSFCGHALGDHDFSVPEHAVQEVCVSGRKSPLAGYRHNLPVGLVHFCHHSAVLRVVL